MIYNVQSLIIKLLIIFLLLDVVYWQFYSQPITKKFQIDRNQKLLKEINQTKKEIKKLSKQANAIIKEYKMDYISNINQNLKDSQVQVSSRQDEIPLEIDFKRGEKNVFQLSLKDFTETQIPGALAVDVEIIWCSQFVSGYISMGTILGMINTDNIIHNNFEWNNINQLNDGSHNQWNMFTIQNDKSCQTQSERIELIQPGQFFVQSNGYNNQDSGNEFDSGRNKTQFSMIIKGYQIKQDIPEITELKLKGN